MRSVKSIILGFVLGTVGCMIFLSFQPEARPLFTREYWSAIYQFGTVLRLMKADHVSPDEWTVQGVTEKGIQAMLRAADPYSGLMTGGVYEEFRSEKSQQYVGIGVEITFRNKHLTILAPFEGGPAQEVGIFPGDQIIKVDGNEIAEWEYSKVLRYLRGEAGTEVSLTLFRPMSKETLEFTVKRRAIDVNTVSQGKILHPGIGYLRISRFSERTDKEFFEQLDLLKRQGAFNALIIDLRNNPGGLLDVCLRLIGHFYPRGETLLRVVSPSKGMDLPQLNSIGGSRPDFAIAILIDPASASASEIMAATLQESGLATLFGEPSFGKASVQSVLEIGKKEALRLTTAKYLTSQGKNIAGEGVIPDIRTGIQAEDSAQIFLQNSLGVHTTPTLFEEQFGVPWKEDDTLNQAVDWLKKHDIGG